jgi:hypothetical protein
MRQDLLPNVLPVNGNAHPEHELIQGVHLGSYYDLKRNDTPTVLTHSNTANLENWVTEHHPHEGIIFSALLNARASSVSVTVPFIIGIVILFHIGQHGGTIVTVRMKYTIVRNQKVSIISKHNEERQRRLTTIVFHVNCYPLHLMKLEHCK